MKSISPKKSHKKALFTGVIITALLLAGTAYLFFTKTGPFAYNTDTTINLNEPTEEEKKTGVDIKERSINTTEDNGKTTTGSDPSPQPTPVEGSTRKSVHAEITAASQNESTLQVRTLIQTVTSSGVCTISMTGPQGKIYKSTAGVQALASSSTCKGFDIPLDQLTLGTWELSLNYESTDIIATASKEITIK